MNAAPTVGLFSLIRHGSAGRVQPNGSPQVLTSSIHPHEHRNRIEWSVEPLCPLVARRRSDPFLELLLYHWRHFGFDGTGRVRGTGKRGTTEHISGMVDSGGAPRSVRWTVWRRRYELNLVPTAQLHLSPLPALVDELVGRRPPATDLSHPTGLRDGTHGARSQSWNGTLARKVAEYATLSLRASGLRALGDEGVEFCFEPRQDFVV